MTHAPPTTPTDSTDDAVCVRCGYSLRGLPTGGRCPECGSEIQTSLSAGSALRNAPPAWLASLAGGAALIVAGLIGYVNLGNFRVPPMVYHSHWLLSAASFAAGVWLITRPHPRFGTGPPALRWGLRGLSCVAVAQSLGTIAAIATGTMAPGTIAATGLGFAYDLVRWLAVPFPYLFFLHLRPLAQRLPSPSIARHCAILGPAASAALLVFVGVGQAARTWLWTDPVRFEAWRLPVLVPMLTAGVALVILSVWAAITLVRFCFGVLKSLAAARAAAAA